MLFLRFIYNILTHLSWLVLKGIALFQPKMRLFVSGRKNTFDQLRSSITPNSKCIWMHVASLGEFEQGLPILEQLRQQYPNHKLVLSFFSPSGYEVKKNTSAADVVVYLPMDTRSNASQFVDLVNPVMAIFIKYEIWPNYLHQLRQRKIPTLLVSAIFSKRQVFFKPYGGFMRNSLHSFSHFFVQDDTSKTLLQSIGFANSTVSGDTRFDRVYEILNRDNHLDFMEQFKGNQPCLVAGSTWPEDEKILVDYINSSDKGVKFVLAPHKIKPDHIEQLLESISKKTICYSNIDNQNLMDFDVLIIDTIGLLTKIYSYAQMAYVGGGFATGLHNTLEPAVYGIPVVIGPNYEGFKEAEDLVDLKGVLPVSSSSELKTTLDRFLENPDVLENTGKINSTYITQNVGATPLIMEHIDQIL
ncbi:3-deoxy-D-manno-octulosonic acid transferase [Flagellimonas olearia]|uniref:3-deoxy-D-manno-octulosonic acid transferase n=1 Tax=Flagellimonas olearia TaxID=552546 RepID=A0A444VIM4_9FLAO|nr:glycosyltransferase N-terminal domain-containing protein [Allomuricauda olearia]RYC50584.1 3-deoxy-D-manno-octulosonic acid transferase [Allomuricauda olearia]